MSQCVSNRRSYSNSESCRMASTGACSGLRGSANARLMACSQARPLHLPTSPTISPRGLQQQHHPHGGPSSSSSSERGCRSSTCCSAAVTQGVQAASLLSTQQSSAAAAAVVAAEAIRRQQEPQPQQAEAHRFATLTRILLTGNNTTMFRQVVGQRRSPTAGPLGLLLFLFTLIAASLAAIRAALVRKVRGCRSCRGYGIQRCRLCMGAGRVDWTGKLSHYDVCPLCMNRRFVVCEGCGGHHHRTLFSHLRRRAGGAVQSPFPDFALPGAAVAAGAGAAQVTGNMASISSLESVDFEIAGVGAVSSARND